MKIINDGITFFENNPTIKTDSEGNIIYSFLGWIFKFLSYSFT